MMFQYSNKHMPRDVWQLVLQCFSAGPILAWLIHTLSGSDGTLAAVIFYRQVLIAHVHMKCWTNSRFVLRPGPDL